MSVTAQNMMMTVPFFGVTNMESSLDFYVRGLGFTVTIEWKPIAKIEWCWITRDQIAIMLQEPRNSNHAIHSSAMTKGFGISICIQCMDAIVLYHEFKNKGLQPTRFFVSNNRWTFAVVDPDGYKLEFSSATDVEEGTIYGEGRMLIARKPAVDLILKVYSRPTWPAQRSLTIREILCGIGLLKFLTSFSKQS